MNKIKWLYLMLLTVFAGITSCHSIDDERIPNMPVNISLSDPGLWNTYGVSGFGSHRNFIYGSQPANFTYKSGSATGFGGVLLIEGVDPFGGQGTYPLAYDLACPIERKADVRVKINPESYMAECAQCKSIYDVTVAAGAAIGGEAATGKYKYALKMYSVIPSGTGGYYITN